MEMYKCPYCGALEMINEDDGWCPECAERELHLQVCERLKIGFPCPKYPDVIKIKS